MNISAFLKTPMLNSNTLKPQPRLWFCCVKTRSGLMVVPLETDSQQMPI